MGTKPFVWSWSPIQVLTLADGLNFRAGCLSSLFSSKIPYIYSSVLSEFFESFQLLLSCLAAVFCLAEVSLFCFDRSFVTLLFLQKNISYTTFPSLRFSTLSSPSPCEYLVSSLRKLFSQSWSRSSRNILVLLCLVLGEKCEVLYSRL